MAVGQLSAELPVTRPAVSQHLKVLKQAGLVADQAEGTRRIYRIDPTGVQAIRNYLDQMWGQALAGFQDAAERMAQAERNADSKQNAASGEPQEKA
jgi:DNA-binding transcriptional ArsR family regulator